MRSVYRYILGLILFVAMVAIYTDRVEAFSDTGHHWAGLEIEHLRGRELISGYPDGAYRPEANISRQEFVVLLIRAMNKQREAEVLQQGVSFFNDSNTWAKGYVELAHEMNLAEGDNQGIFSPDRPISREEAVVILVKCMGTKDESEPVSQFADETDISSWAYPSVTQAIDQGLIHGFPDNTFRPQSKLTRAQVAIMLEAFLSHMGRQYQIYGTITQIDLPLNKVLVTVNGRQESFELASNVAVWSRERRAPESEIKLPANACLDLNANGKLSFILIIDQNGIRPAVKLDYNRISPDYGSLGQGNRELVSLAADEEMGLDQMADQRQAAGSLLTTREAMGGNVLTKQTGASGKGQLVAVIDSGIDPGHPDLQKTSQGYQKIINYIDLTDEGKVLLTPLKAVDGYLTTKNGTRLDVSGIANSGAVFMYGYLTLDFMPDATGLAARRLQLVLSESKTGHGYDTAYFDTNDDGRFGDEKAIKKYSLNQQYVSIKGESNRELNLVLCEISNKENYVRLGFDAQGHGTEVAGVTAASGEVNGTAPDAQLMAIKIMDSEGSSSLKKLESALSLAAEAGAGVAVVSLGQYNMSTVERESLAQTAATIWKNKTMIICMASGNSGPGMESVTDSTGIDHILTVGAYATPEMWATDYGWQVPEPTLWYFSSTGPATDAGTAPLLLAPGSAVSTFPMWADSLYHKDEGTSIAAPHLAGAAALLLDANMHRLYRDNKAAVYEALLASAKPIKGLQAVEQGYGTVNLPGAWQELQRNQAVSDQTEAKQYSPGVDLAKGLYSRGLIPAELSLHLVNSGDTSVNYFLGSFANWIKPDYNNVQVPAHSERTVGIKYEMATEPGLYSSYLMADNLSSLGFDAVLPQTIVIPRDMRKIKENEESGRLTPGGLQHYYFRIAPASSKLVFKLMIKDGKGRGRITVIAPDGARETSSFAGVDERQNVLSASLSYPYPVEGIWEVVVYSSVSLSFYDLDATDYVLQTVVEAGGSEQMLPPEDRYFVSSVGPSITPGKPVNLTLFFWNRGSKLPANGLVSIDGRLYEIQNGIVSLSYLPQQETINLKLAW